MLLAPFVILGAANHIILSEVMGIILTETKEREEK
jgi:hypothetical protein